MHQSLNFHDSQFIVGFEDFNKNLQGDDFERALWIKFAEAATPEAFCKSWLALQCHMLKGIQNALLLIGPPNSGPFTPIAVWPNPKRSVKHLTGAAQQSLKERRGLFIHEDSTKHKNCQVTYPIEVSGKLHGVVILELEPRPRHEIQDIMRQLHWGAAWLNVMLLRTETFQSSETNERLQKLLDLVACAIEHERFQPAAIAFVNSLATSLNCDRVSLGFVKRRHVSLYALSHSADFGKQMNLVSAIESAMDEAVDQKAIIVYPLPSDTSPMVTRAHEELAQKHGAGAICTLPMGKDEEYLGALTLERPVDKPFDKATVELCETAAALLGPILNAKRFEDKWLIVKAWEAFIAQLKKLFGPGHPLLKACSVGLLSLFLFFAFATGDYRITAPTILEGSVQRVVSSPFNGYIKEAPARAGDIVQEGDMLCLLDERDLKLERLNWTAQKEQFLKQQREAMAKNDLGNVRILRAKIDQAETQISLLDEQLVRTKIIAPFNGIVISGDLSQSLGAPVERGQILFEVAPLDAYRVIVEIDEREVDEITRGQKGKLVLLSLPGESFPFIVEKVTPVSTAKEGRNYFRVEARLERISESLRPGMEGVGKIITGRRRLIWIWTHEVFDWLRLKFWSWWP